MTDFKVARYEIVDIKTQAIFPYGGLKINQPGWNAVTIGNDLYLNPWWGRDLCLLKARAFCNLMTETMGPPDFWNDGNWIPRLLWGPRHLHITNRPHFQCWLSATNGPLFYGLWLPWRGEYQYEDKFRPHYYNGVFYNPQIATKGHIYGGNILDKDVDMRRDISDLHRYLLTNKYSLDNCPCHRYHPGTSRLGHDAIRFELKDFNV